MTKEVAPNANSARYPQRAHNQRKIPPMTMIPARAEPSCISPKLALQRFGFAKAPSCHFKPARCKNYGTKSALYVWTEDVHTVVLSGHPHFAHVAGSMMKPRDYDSTLSMHAD